MGDAFEASSAGIGCEEPGSPVYPPAALELARHGIGCEGKRAVRLRKADFGRYDLFVAMDRQNLRAMGRLFGTGGRQRLLLSFAGREEDVSDPWYTRDFAAAYRDIEEGCAALLSCLAGKAGGEPGTPHGEGKK